MSVVVLFHFNFSLSVSQGHSTVLYIHVCSKGANCPLRSEFKFGLKAIIFSEMEPQTFLTLEKFVF